MADHPYPMAHVANVLGTTCSGPPTETEIRHLLIDSRKLSAPHHSLFFALTGDRHNGHDYIPELIKKGLHQFVVSESDWPARFPEASFIVVDNTLTALQTLAAHHRSQFSQPCLGITGSNGKTIVKEWLFQLLAPDHSIVRSPKSYNSQVGVPLSLWHWQPGHTLALIEAGISMPGEMARLETMIRPTWGLITNIGAAHQENFQDLSDKVREKLALFSRCDTLFYCSDQLDVREEIEANSNLQGIRHWTWSNRPGANVEVIETRMLSNKTAVHARCGSTEYRFDLPFSDQASLENGLHCLSVLAFLKVEPDQVKERMEALSPVAMRLELIKGINQCSIINDTYNSDLGALSVALDLLGRQHQHPRQTVILSDMLQSGIAEEDLYATIADLLKRQRVNRLIGIGPAISGHREAFDLPEQQFFDSTEAFFAERASMHFRDEAILIKGARPFSFERISQVLQSRHHETVLEIDLSSMVANLNYFRSLLNPGVKLMVMVKAFSYGSGTHEIAHLLAFHRVDYLAVAYSDEGVALRRSGVELPIMVMNAEPGTYEDVIRYRLEPELFKQDQVERFTEELNRSPFWNKEPYPVHLKLDTGMHRLGFTDPDLTSLLDWLEQHPELKVASMFTHLAASDEPQHDPFTQHQLEQLDQLSARIQEAMAYPVLKHALNSAGIQRLPHAQYDMVRLGIGLHGVGVDAEQQAHLQPVASLKTHISQIKEVEPGESVGYARAGKVESPTRIATVAIGYADGFSRRWSKGVGKMLVNGQLAPVIGNVCMDMCMLDITGLEVNEGDEVVVFGPGREVTEMAAELNTIPYEIMSGISQRVRRVYFQE